MKSQGVVIWTRAGAGALILWCSDNGGLVYVADRRKAGDPHAALTVGDFVEFRIETVGAMRIGRDLSFRASGAGWIREQLGRTAGTSLSPVVSQRRDLARLPGFDPDAAKPQASGDVSPSTPSTPADDPVRRGTRRGTHKGTGKT